MYRILYNPLANNGKGKEEAKKAEQFIDGEASYTDITSVDDYKSFFETFSENDVLVICGGDGTLNRFINFVDPIPDFDILYYPSGSGNDFYGDVAEGEPPHIIRINDYLKDLPIVEVNGKEYKFINGVGYGIDGYCCEVGDKIREEHPNEEINYAGIAIKGLLFHFKPRKSEISVDGVKYSYKKTWLAPTMNGRKYGGGMIPTPDQKRFSDDKKLSVLAFHDSAKLKTLMIFPNIFKGKHTDFKNNCIVYEGKRITVSFDKPTAIQIDGETILNVTGYTAHV